MVLNSKGQVTIPAHLRAKYGCTPGMKSRSSRRAVPSRSSAAKEPKAGGSGWSGGYVTRPPAET